VDHRNAETADIHNQLEGAHIKVDSLQSALEQEQMRLVSARTALEDEKQRTSRLSNDLNIEQSNVADLVKELNRYMQECENLKDVNRSLVQKWEDDFDNVRTELQQTVRILEEERVTVSSLRRELDVERDQKWQTEQKLQAKLAELQSMLERQSPGINGFSNGSGREQAAIMDIQAMLDLERSRMSELQAALQKEKTKVANLNRALETEKQDSRSQLEDERDVTRQLSAEVSRLQSREEELQDEIMLKEKMLSAAESDRVRLQSSLISNVGKTVDGVDGTSAWSEERATLVLQLNDAQKTIVRLRESRRKLEIELEKEKDKSTAPSTGKASLDKDKMQRLYGKYLRCESFRRALVYQKKYLLLLLGGFQDCEEQMLVLISRMGVYPESQHLKYSGTITKPLSRFRSAARVVIAIARLRWLVNKWRQAVRVGGPAVAGRLQSPSGSPLTNGAVNNERLMSPVGRSRTPSVPTQRRQTPQGSEPRHQRTVIGSPPTRDTPAHSYHQSGSPTYSPHRDVLSSYENGDVRRRSRSPYAEADGQSSPGGDKMLTDYITRLEHIQAQLGTVSQPVIRGRFSTR